MPLSDHERQVLEEIERNLYAGDPDFGRHIRAPASRFPAKKQLRLGGLTFVAGFALLLLFFVTRLVLLGVLAFAGMVAAIVLISGALRSLASSRRNQVDAARRLYARLIGDWDQRLRQRYKRP